MSTATPPGNESLNQAMSALGDALGGALGGAATESEDVKSTLRVAKIAAVVVASVAVLALLFYVMR